MHDEDGHDEDELSPVRWSVQMQAQWDREQAEARRSEWRLLTIYFVILAASALALIWRFLR